MRRWLQEVLARLEDQPRGTHSLFNLGSIVLSAAALGQCLPPTLLASVLADFRQHAQPEHHRQVGAGRPAGLHSRLKHHVTQLGCIPHLVSACTASLRSGRQRSQTAAGSQGALPCRCTRLTRTCCAAQLACLAYALAALDQLSVEALADLCAPLCQLDPAELPNEELYQLRMVRHQAWPLPDVRLGRPCSQQAGLQLSTDGHRQRCGC